MFYRFLGFLLSLSFLLPIHHIAAQIVEGNGDITVKNLIDGQVLDGKIEISFEAKNVDLPYPMHVRLEFEKSGHKKPFYPIGANLYPLNGIKTVLFDTHKITDGKTTLRVQLFAYKDGKPTVVSSTPIPLEILNHPLPTPTPVPTPEGKINIMTDLSGYRVARTIRVYFDPGTVKNFIPEYFTLKKSSGPVAPRLYERVGLGWHFVIDTTEMHDDLATIQIFATGVDLLGNQVTVSSDPIGFFVNNSNFIETPTPTPFKLPPEKPKFPTPKPTPTATPEPTPTPPIFIPNPTPFPDPIEPSEPEIAPEVSPHPGNQEEGQKETPVEAEDSVHEFLSTLLTLAINTIQDLLKDIPEDLISVETISNVQMFIDVIEANKEHLEASDATQQIPKLTKRFAKRLEKALKQKRKRKKRKLLKRSSRILRRLQKKF